MFFYVSMNHVGVPPTKVLRELSELDLVSVAVKASLSFWWLLGGCDPPRVRDALFAAVAMPLPQWACPLFVAWCSGCKVISVWPEVLAPFPDATGVVLKISRWSGLTH